MTLIPEECQLEYWLQLRGISKAEFARRMKVSRATVTDWCNTKQLMSLTNAFNAAHILDCSIHDIYKTTPI